MTSPVTSRLPFTFPTPLVYDDIERSQTYDYPHKTDIGISPRPMLYSVEVCPEPTCFDPSRWLTYESISASGAKGDGCMLKTRQTNLKAMEHYFKQFGGGPRRCIGMNFAYANLYHILAAVVRRFDFEITDIFRAGDVDMNRDHFVSMKGEVKGFESGKTEMRRRKYSEYGYYD